jgi:hypothetical protein
VDQFRHFCTQFCNALILLLLKHRQVLDVLIGRPELLLEVSNFPFLVVKNQKLGIHIFCWNIADLICSGCVLQC